MISTAPIDWRRLSPQNASVFELQNLCIALKAWLAQLRVTERPHMQTHKHGGALFQAILRMTQYAPCTAQKNDTDKWACTVRTADCILD